MGFHLGTVFLRLVLLTSTADGELRKLANRSTSFPFSLLPLDVLCSYQCYARGGGPRDRMGTLNVRAHPT